MRWPLHLIYPLDSMFNGLTEAAVKDLWDCPLLTPKWAQSLARIAIIDSPTRIIRPCHGSPQAEWRQLCIVTIQSNGVKLPPILPMMKEVCWKGSESIKIFADAPINAVTITRRIIQNTLQDTTFSFAPQERSPVHTKAAPRFRITACMPLGALTTFDLAGRISLMQQDLWGERHPTL